jgi:uncharacterized protein (DUF1778 family)
MPVRSPRNRLVNFRVNVEEYESLRTACASHGARSISDFARLAVLSRAKVSERRAGSVQRQLSALGLTLSELEVRVRRMLRLLESTGRSGSHAPSEEEEGVCL